MRISAVRESMSKSISTDLPNITSMCEKYIEKRIVPYAAFKRFLDFLAALFVLAILFPLFLAIAIAIKVTSPGSIIFKQVRIGHRGRPFIFYKFRSMFIDAEARRESLQHLNESVGPTFKIKNDPRVTPIGRWLRKLSLDELPQFFNVLMGDMSLVGPRPPLPAEVEQYTPIHTQRLAVTPGITCLWQISGRSNVSFDHWVEMDIFYIENMSFWLDLKILLLTIPAVMKGEGAY
jgi:exopolysaccharide biosynthesis polyprenyl glycosylphosphotransferase